MDKIEIPDASHPLAQVAEAINEMAAAGESVSSARGDQLNVEMQNLGVVWTCARLAVVSAQARLRQDDPDFDDLRDSLSKIDAGLTLPELRKTYGEWLDRTAAAFHTHWRQARAAAGDVGALAAEVQDIKRLLQMPVRAIRDDKGNITASVRDSLPMTIATPTHPDFRALRACAEKREQTLQILSRQRYAIPYFDGGDVLAVVHGMRDASLDLVRPTPAR